MIKKELSIIIVNYNTKDLLRNCLNSIAAKFNNVDYEIIVVDNASFDKSIEMLTIELPQIRLIANKENVGFARANNQAIGIAQGINILLLNSDTIIKNSSMTKLLEFINGNPKIGVVGCRVLNSDGTLQHTCYHQPNLLTETIFFVIKIIKNLWDPFTCYKFMPFHNHKKIIKVDCIVGCFLLIKKKVFEKVGLFDENFFIYYEDSEFCKRVRERSNYEIYYHPKVEIVHLKGVSANINNDSIIHCYESARHYFTKCYGYQTQKIFNFLCHTIWRVEIFIFSLCKFNKKFNHKLIMIRNLYNL